MANDPTDPFKDPPPETVWHLAPTVRDYFNMVEDAMMKCLATYDDLYSVATASFAKLSEKEQDASFESAMQELHEETPIRALKQHLPEDEYKKLLGLVGRSPYR